MRDAYRFILYYKWSIENRPLQAYASALIFSPAGSLMKSLFKKEEPEWITTKPTMERNWSPCLQTLEGHSDNVTTVAFSDDSSRLVSASRDKTVKIWDPATGHCLQTLEGHNDWVNAVAFSHNNNRLASMSRDKTSRSGTRRQATAYRRSKAIENTSLLSPSRMTTAASRRHRRHRTIIRSRSGIR